MQSTKYSSVGRARKPAWADEGVERGDDVEKDNLYWSGSSPSVPNMGAEPNSRTARSVTPPMAQVADRKARSVTPPRAPASGRQDMVSACSFEDNAFDVNQAGRQLNSTTPRGREAARRPEHASVSRTHEDIDQEYSELLAEKERSQAALESLSSRIQSLRQEVDAQRRNKPTSCASCRAVTMQVDAAAQSLLGSAGYVARALLRDPNADRRELLDIVLRYMEPVKHLDPDLEDLYSRAQANVQSAPKEKRAKPVPDEVLPENKNELAMGEFLDFLATLQGIRSLQELYDQMDLSHSDVVTKSEFNASMSSLGFKGDPKVVWRLIDTDGDGMLTKREFMSLEPLVAQRVDNNATSPPKQGGQSTQARQARDASTTPKRVAPRTGQW
eukprot:CAMPEP_0117497328 /NCGR_PEP_ID=MMETSP0784-20121206/21126_1 /TAXON_ID=39447 /ORGANISM="" /LENGTH=385 /DNA_ID=CAMNT_0005292347 /DNA_START=15 /DNA_END=1169 /DNA_ORIENTATION=-